jgi:hypothetical protein
MKDEYCNKKDKDYIIDDGEEKIGNRSNVLALAEFTSIKEMFNPFTPQAAAGLNHFRGKKDRDAHYRAVITSMYAPSLWWVGGSERATVYVMAKARDSTCRPGELSQLGRPSQQVGVPLDGGQE